MPPHLGNHVCVLYVCVHYKVINCPHIQLTKNYHIRWLNFYPKSVLLYSKTQLGGLVNDIVKCGDFNLTSHHSLSHSRTLCFVLIAQPGNWPHLLVREITQFQSVVSQYLSGCHQFTMDGILKVNYLILLCSWVL